MCACVCVPSEIFEKEAKNQESINKDIDLCQKMYQIVDMGTFKMRIYSNFEAKKGAVQTHRDGCFPFWSRPFCLGITALGVYF